MYTRQGVYFDVYVVHTNGERLWVNRLLLFGPRELISTSDGNVFSGRCVNVAAGHIAVDWTNIRFQGRRGAFIRLSVAFQTEVIAQETLGFIHPDGILGDPASLSDARLKHEVTPISGDQALSVLNLIQGCTYNREDLGQRRLGLIADEVETAITGLSIDNVVGSKHATFNDVEDEYKTLDYSRLVSFCIPAINTLNQQVTALTAELDALKSRLPKKKSNGTSSLSSK